MQINNKNVFEDIKTYPDYFFNTLYCDPPYNLGSQWIVDKNGRYVITKKSDFMSKWEGLDEFDLLMFSSKVSGAERNEGLEDSGNKHPTLKPIKLNSDVLSLFKLPDECNQKIYIPFAGVFSEVIGAVKAGYNTDNIYGCELKDYYYNIGLKRLDYFTNKPNKRINKFI